jgi:hypothetical protein
MSPPEYTKKTRCDNNIPTTNNHDFFRPIISNISVPINYNHEHYTNSNMYSTNTSNLTFDIERSSISTRNNTVDSKKPVQESFQNNYHTMNFDKMNHQSNQEINNFLTRNPVNSRRDNIEKSRNTDKQEFLKNQGGSLSNYTDLPFENTRKEKITINSSNYLPMPRTMAIPRENI